jgi:hypothetical protein
MKNIDEAATRVSALPKALLKVLACVSEGMSNTQIASRLGYKNAGTVGTLVYEINKRLGLAQIASRQEKRQLAIDAFKSSADPVRVPIIPIFDKVAGLNTITIGIEYAAQIRSLFEQGYELEAVEVILRKSR